MIPAFQALNKNISEKIKKLHFSNSRIANSEDTVVQMFNIPASDSAIGGRL